MLWGISEDESLVFSDDGEIMMDVCGISSASFPAGMVNHLPPPPAAGCFTVACGRVHLHKRGGGARARRPPQAQGSRH